VPARNRSTSTGSGNFVGVTVSIVSLASISRPLLFARIYFGLRDTWRGIILAVGVGIYPLAIPLISAIRRSPTAPQSV
jgi:hypothetical protein